MYLASFISFILVASGVGKVPVTSSSHLIIECILGNLEENTGLNLVDFIFV